jgi:hypothetical protein
LTNIDSDDAKLFVINFISGREPLDDGNESGNCHIKGIPACCLLIFIYSLPTDVEFCVFWEK